MATDLSRCPCISTRCYNMLQCVPMHKHCVAAIDPLACTARATARVTTCSHLASLLSFRTSFLISEGTTWYSRTYDYAVVPLTTAVGYIKCLDTSVGRQ